MKSTSHEREANQMAKDYAAGDRVTRRHIAETCEEQGILAALVALALPTEALRADFIQAMIAVVTSEEKLTA